MRVKVYMDRLTGAMMFTGVEYSGPVVVGWELVGYAKINLYDEEGFELEEGQTL